MPYRTAPEKPVRIRIQLTARELKEAVKEYVNSHKGVIIPVEFKHWYYDRNLVTKEVGVGITYYKKIAE